MPVPNDFKEELMKGTFDLVNDTVRLLLLDDSSAYTFDADAHEFVDDLDGTSDGDDPTNEMSGTGYSRQTLANAAVTEDTADDEGVFDADDVTLSSLDAGTIQTIVVYQQIGGDDTTPGNDRVIAVFDNATVGDLPLTSNGGDVTISWNSEGIVNIA